MCLVTKKIILHFILLQVQKQEKVRDYFCLTYILDLLP